MGFKHFAKAAILGTSLVLGTGHAETVMEQQPSLFPHLVAHFHKVERGLTDTVSCAEPTIKATYADSKGEEYTHTIKEVTTRLNGTMTQLIIRCPNEKPLVIGDGLMPVTTAKQLYLFEKTDHPVVIEQQGNDYQLQAKDTIEVFMQKYHGSVPFQKLHAVSTAYNSVKSVVPSFMLQRVTIRPLNEENSYAEEGPFPDEIMIGEENLQNTESALHIIALHEMWHVALKAPALQDLRQAFEQKIGSLSAEQQRVFAHKVNETNFYSAVFSTTKQDTTDMEEQMVRFMTTYGIKAMNSAQGDTKKAALDALEQLLATL